MEQQQELISVVIPCYNRADRLPVCVESVLGQTYRNIEVLVVDDGSGDNTPALFEGPRDPRLRYLRYEENRGACYARNYGAAHAQGAYLAFQDSDDTWRPEKLEKQLAFLQETGSDLVFCGMRRIPERGEPFYYPVHDFHPENALADFLEENRAGTQTMLMKRSVWEALRFDESFRRYQDWDFGIRAAGRFRLAYLPQALVDSAVGGDSISTAVRSYPALAQLYTKHAALYAVCPAADAVMNRRMGLRIRRTQPLQAAEHFMKSFRLSRKWYDLAYALSCRLRALKKQKQGGALS